MANLKNITELPVVESADGLKLIVNDNGFAKQIVASAVVTDEHINNLIDAKVTDEHINSLIDAKLGVIANGTY